MSAATFTDVLRSELTKLRSLRSTTYSLLATVALGIGFGAIFSLAGGREYSSLSASEQMAFDPAAISLAGYNLAQLAVGVLGVLVITSEYATGMIRTSLTVAPRRHRLLAAKAIVFVVVALVIGEIVGFGSFFTGQAVVTAQGAPSATLSQPDVLRAVAGTGLYLAAIGLLGVALGVLLRATAGALTVIVAATLLVPAFMPALPQSWAEVVAKYWPTMAGRQLLAVKHNTVMLDPWTGFGVLCAAVAAALIAAFIFFRLRDA